MTTAMTMAEHAASDDGGGRDGCRAAALQHAAFALGGHRRHQVAEAGRDNPERDNAGHIGNRGADPPARDRNRVAPAAEYRSEDHQKQDRQGEGEELCLAVADERAQVVAALVQCHSDHRWSFVLVEPVRTR